MLLQLNLNEPQHLGLLSQMQGIVDIIKIDNLLLKRFGLAVITTARELCPQTLVFADSQTVNDGARQADMLFNAGAAFISVLSCASSKTIETVGICAHAYGATIVLDMTNDVNQNSIPLAAFNLPDTYDYIATTSFEIVHKLHEKGKSVLLQTTNESADIDKAISASPEILAMGHPITQASNAREIAQSIKNKLPARGLGWPWDDRLVTLD